MSGEIKAVILAWIGLIGVTIGAWNSYDRVEYFFLGGMFGLIVARFFGAFDDRPANKASGVFQRTP